MRSDCYNRKVKLLGNNPPWLSTPCSVLFTYVSFVLYRHSLPSSCQPLGRLLAMWSCFDKIHYQFHYSSHLELHRSSRAHPILRTHLQIHISFASIFNDISKIVMPQDFTRYLKILCKTAKKIMFMMTKRQ